MIFGRYFFMGHVMPIKKISLNSGSYKQQNRKKRKLFLLTQKKPVLLVALDYQLIHGAQRNCLLLMVVLELFV